MDRRDCTSIKIEILRTLYLSGQAGVYSGRLGSLANKLCTNHYTFTRALAELEREGLLVCEEMPLATRAVKVIRLSEDGRRLVATSLLLLSKL